MKILFVSLFDEWCLGLRSLTATLKAEGHQVGLAYLQSMPEMNGELGKDDPEGYHVPPASVPGRDFQALAALVSEQRPDLIGFSFTSNFSGLAERATELLRPLTDAKFIWGGVDVTANPDVAIQFADIVCVGEGEGAMIDLTRRIAAGEGYTDVPNLWVREGEKVHKNKVRPLIQELDELPWVDFSPEDKFWISSGEIHRGRIPTGSHLEHNFPIMTTRGCPYSCSFCCNAMYRDLYGSKDYVRMRSVDSVCAEIEAFIAKNPHVGSIEFWDDVFGVRQKWVEEFADQFPRRVGLPFWCYTYPAFCRPELVKNLRRAGASFIVMGIQSGSERILKEVYNRNAPRKRVIEAANLIMGEGMLLVLDLIGSNPFETEEDNYATLDLMLSLPSGFALQDINPLTFYRNYPISDLAEREGLLNPMLDGRNVALDDDSLRYRFWNALLSLTQFHDQLGADSIRRMADDPYLREHPETVEALSKSLVESTYLPGTRFFRRDEEPRLRREIGRLSAEVKRYKGSRAVRTYFRLKSFLGFNGHEPLAPSPEQTDKHIKGATAFQC